MASFTSKIVCLFMILSLAVPSTLATEYVVCGDLGWAVGVDIAAWLPKIVRVGDTFKFNFKSPQTVAVVDTVGYLTCTLSGLICNDISGDFSFTFTKPGIFNFISAGHGDCNIYDLTNALRLQVLVL